ncbi:endonuclease/exonuclease/phosphatase family protein [Actinomadura sp. NPDC047616]|uniref:endonuclease/exonuclease/phosphatase family protein n=1 Tax=Actinomadura sp. NPDC047616 TaxID=3155914 RepID=UPI0033C72C26
MSTPSPLSVADRRETEAAADTRRRWCRGTRLLVAASLAWLAFVLLHIALAGRLWLWQLFELAPPLMFLAVPALLLAGIPLLRIVRDRVPRSAKWWIVLTLSASVAVSAGRTGINVSALGAEPAVPPGAVRVMAWNTEYWNQFDRGGLDRLYPFLRGQRADVYLLSEHVSFSGKYYRYPIRDSVRLRREFPGFHMAATGELLTMSRYPIVASRPVGTTRGIPDERSGWTEFWSDKALRTDLLVGGRTLSVYNVHIPVQLRVDMNPFSGRFWDWLQEALPWRQGQYDALEQDIRANPNPILVAGDFNGSPTHMGFDWRGQGLRDAMGAGGPLFPASWPERGVLPLPPVWRLDWTFVSPGVRVHRYAFRSARDAGSRDPGKKWRALSDHRTQNLIISLGDSR